MLMAKMTIKGLDEYALKLSKLGQKEGEIAKKAVYSGAGIVADEIKRRLIQNLNDPASVGKSGDSMFKDPNYEPTGDLLESFGIAPIRAFANMETSTKLGFDGYDRNGVPNQLKARAMESGTSALRKRPFVRPAVNATKKPAQAKMGEIIDEETKKVMGGK